MAGFLNKNKVSALAKAEEIENRKRFLREAEKETRENLKDLAKRQKQKNVVESY